MQSNRTESSIGGDEGGGGDDGAERAERRERLDQQVVKLQVESEDGRLRAEWLRVEQCIDEEVKLRKYSENAKSYILYGKC
jgi:hypothetical protein